MFRRSRLSVRPNVSTIGRTGAASQEPPPSNEDSAKANIQAETPVSAADTKPADEPIKQTPGDSNEQHGETAAASAIQRRKRFSVKPKVLPGRPSALPRTPKSPIKPTLPPVKSPAPVIDKAEENSTAPRQEILPSKDSRSPTTDNVLPVESSGKNVHKPNETVNIQPCNKGKEISPKTAPVPRSIPDREAIEISEKAKTLMSKANLAASSQQFSLSQLLNDKSDLVRLEKARKLRQLLKQEMLKGKTKKAKANIKEHSLDPSKMTMRDLIRYLPAANPMSTSLESQQENETVLPSSPAREASPERAQEAEIQPKKFSPSRAEQIDDASAAGEEQQQQQQEEEEEEAAAAGEEEEDGEDEDAVMVPQVKVAEDGSLIIDEESLTVEVQRMKGPNTIQDRDPIFERGSTTTYSSFRKGTHTKPWSTEETDMFFLAISMVGTDFSMICQLFPHRTRTEIKNKFKKEERHNAWRIDKAFRERRRLDLEYFKKLLQKIIEYQESKKKLKAISGKDKTPRKRKRKSSKKDPVSLSDVEEEVEDDISNEEQEGEKENLCNKTTSDSRTKRKRKDKDDPSPDSKPEKKKRKKVPDDEAIPAENLQDDVETPESDKSTEATQKKPEKTPLGRKARKAAKSKAIVSDKGESTSDETAEAQIIVHSPKTTERLSDNDSDQEVTVLSSKPTRSGRISKPVQSLNYPAKEDRHSSASDGTLTSPGRDAPSKPKSKTQGKRRSAQKQAPKESKKPTLITLRASQSEESDDDEEEAHAPHWDEENSKDAFVPASLCSPKPVVGDVEETMEELLPHDMPDVLGMSTNALFPDELEPNDSGSLEPCEHQLDLLVDVIDFLSEHTEASEDEAAQTLLAIGNLSNLPHLTDRQASELDHTSNDESSICIEVDDASISFQLEEYNESLQPPTVEISQTAELPAPHASHKSEEESCSTQEKSPPPKKGRFTKIKPKPNLGSRATQPRTQTVCVKETKPVEMETTATSQPKTSEPLESTQDESEPSQTENRPTNDTTRLMPTPQTGYDPCEVKETTMPPQQTVTPETTMPPQQTVTPETTMPPKQTVTPETTMPPIQTVTPETTMPPIQTVTPETTMPPIQTVTPETTMSHIQKVSPETTMPPKQKVTPETTVSPKQKVTPETTVSPKQKVTPQTTMSHIQTVTPETTLSPEEKVTPEATLAPKEKVTPQTSMSRIQTVTPETTMPPKEKVTPETTMPPKEKVTPETTMPPKQTVTPETTLSPKQTVTPETTLSPEEKVTPETTLSPKQKVTPETTLSPEEKVTPETTLSPEEKVTPEITMSLKEKVTPETTLSPKQTETAKSSTTEPSPVCDLGTSRPTVEAVCEDITTTIPSLKHQEDSVLPVLEQSSSKNEAVRLTNEMPEAKSPEMKPSDDTCSLQETTAAPELPIQSSKTSALQRKARLPKIKPKPNIGRSSRIKSGVDPEEKINLECVTAVTSEAQPAPASVSVCVVVSRKDSEKQADPGSNSGSETGLGHVKEKCVVTPSVQCEEKLQEPVKADDEAMRALELGNKNSTQTDRSSEEEKTDQPAPQTNPDSESSKLGAVQRRRWIPKVKPKLVSSPRTTKSKVEAQDNSLPIGEIVEPTSTTSHSASSKPDTETGNKDAVDAQQASCSFNSTTTDLISPAAPEPISAPENMTAEQRSFSENFEIVDKITEACCSNQTRVESCQPDQRSPSDSVNVHQAEGNTYKHQGISQSRDSVMPMVTAGMSTSEPQHTEAAAGPKTFDYQHVFTDMLPDQVPSDPDEPFFILSLTEIPVCPSGGAMEAQQRNPVEPVLPPATGVNISLSDIYIPTPEKAALGSDLIRVEEYLPSAPSVDISILAEPQANPSRRTLILGEAEDKSKDHVAEASPTETPVKGLGETKSTGKAAATEANQSSDNAKDVPEATTREESPSLTSETKRKPSEATGSKRQTRKTKATRELQKEHPETQSSKIMKPSSFKDQLSCFSSESSDLIELEEGPTNVSESFYSDVFTPVDGANLRSTTKDSAGGPEKSRSKPVETKATRKKQRKVDSSIETRTGQKDTIAEDNTSMVSSSLEETLTSQKAPGKRIGKSKSSNEAESSLRSRLQRTRVAVKSTGALSLDPLPSSSSTVAVPTRESNRQSSKCSSSEPQVSRQSDSFDGSLSEDAPTNVTQFFLGDIFTEVTNDDGPAAGKSTDPTCAAEMGAQATETTKTKTQNRIAKASGDSLSGHSSSLTEAAAGAAAGAAAAGAAVGAGAGAVGAAPSIDCLSPLIQIAPDPSKSKAAKTRGKGPNKNNKSPSSVAQPQDQPPSSCGAPEISGSKKASSVRTRADKEPTPVSQPLAGAAFTEAENTQAQTTQGKSRQKRKTRASSGLPSLEPNVSTEEQPPQQTEPQSASKGTRGKQRIKKPTVGATARRSQRKSTADLTPPQTSTSGEPPVPIPDQSDANEGFDDEPDEISVSQYFLSDVFTEVDDKL